MALLCNTATGEVIARKVRRAQNLWDRTAGFLPRASIDSDEGLWFDDCWAIHTLGMRALIDVIFLDGNGRVLKTHRAVPRHRLAVACPGAKSVVELGDGALELHAVAVGDALRLE